MTQKQTYSVAEAAELLGIHPETLRALLRKGELKAAKFKQWRISRADLEAFYKARGGGDLFEGNSHE